jgi:hypothetical protein
VEKQDSAGREEGDGTGHGRGKRARGAMQVRVFSPRRKPITCQLVAGETFGALRARLGKELGVAGERGILLHHGEQVKDDVPASSRLAGAEEVRAPTAHVARARARVRALARVPRPRPCVRPCVCRV